MTPVMPPITNVKMKAIDHSIGVSNLSRPRYMVRIQS
jgi:hypothetical protein